MDVENLSRLYAGTGDGVRRSESVEFGLVLLEPGADAAQVQAALKNHLDRDVEIFTKNELTRRVRDIWKKEQPVVEVFGLGLAVGFIIGMIVYYQILFTDIADHHAEFATLTAIGYPNGHLMRVIIAQGLYLSIISFLPGLCLSLVFYTLLQHLTGILMEITALRIILVFSLTMLMCVLSGLMAAQKVFRTEPAEVF